GRGGRGAWRAGAGRGDGLPDRPRRDGPVARPGHDRDRGEALRRSGRRAGRVDHRPRLPGDADCRAGGGCRARCELQHPARRLRPDRAGRPAPAGGLLRAPRRQRVAARRDRRGRLRPRGGRPGVRRAAHLGGSRRHPGSGRGDGNRVTEMGIVYLVGAGPGDSGLMTRRAFELIVAADVIVHDRLIPADALAVARADAELLYVGKEPGDASVPQEGIAELLVDRARAGKLVVRLKGGDPFVFGRGGEEAEALAEAEVPFEVVPAAPAGVAAPAYAGIPVTHREDASAVAFVTGHEDPEKEDSALDYGALARFPGTLVFYMGVKALPRISERL